MPREVISNSRFPAIVSKQPAKNIGDNISLFRSGREALYNWLENLITDSNLPKIVLLPGLLPEGIYAPFEKLGWQIHFYGVTDKLIPNEESLATQFERCQPDIAVIIHFFGSRISTHSFENLCAEHDCIMLEDFSHSMPVSWLEQSGSTENYASIASLTKLIGICEGGVLKAPIPDSSATKPVRSSKLYSLVSQFFLQTAPFLEGKLTSLPARIARSAMARIFDPYRMLMTSFTSPSLAGKKSLQALQKIDFEKIAVARKRTAHRYLNHLDVEIFRPLANDFDGSAIPFGFPVSVKNRESLVQHLSARGIFGTTLVNKWDYTPKIDDKATADAVTQILARHFIFPIQERMSESVQMQVIKAANDWAILQKNEGK